MLRTRNTPLTRFLLNLAYVVHISHAGFTHLDQRRATAPTREHSLETRSVSRAQRDPESRAYHDRKIAQGKRHNPAVIALARRRCDVLYAMLRTGSPYQPKTQDQPALTA